MGKINSWYFGVDIYGLQWFKGPKQQKPAKTCKKLEILMQCGDSTKAQFFWAEVADVTLKKCFDMSEVKQKALYQCFKANEINYCKSYNAAKNIESEASEAQGMTKTLLQCNKEAAEAN